MYYEGLLDLLNSDTNLKWNFIYTPRLFILNTEYVYDEDKFPINIEILFNNVSGMLNSEYLRTLCQIDLRFHKLGYYLKFFVDKLGIFTKQNKLNSFSLMWMLVVYLQDVVKPPVLPRIIPDYYTSNGKLAFA